ncbi:MAG: imelysin family protein [Crocinitomicaceae bacterium]|nr:imelysin family protein [Crocinitomicaceae bacterium]
MKKFIIFITALTLASCNKEESEEFNRQSMLTNYYANVIAVNVEDYESSLNILKSSTGAFTSSPSTSTLATLRADFITAYKSYQGIKMINFGPTADNFYCNHANIYPTDTSVINGNISSGTYTLGAASNTDAIGFPAIDYLIYNGSDTEIIDAFTSDANAANRITYLNEIVDKLQSEFIPVKQDWATYQQTFISATGTDVGGSTGIMFNAYIMDIELLKNAKIGIPSGQQTGGMLLPDYVEGYYGDLSFELAIASVNELKFLFNGAEGLGLDDYIKHVEGESITESLADRINAQFDLISTDLSSYSNSLSEAVVSNTSDVNATYFETKKLVTNIKTDAASLLGILITYTDSDGD